MGTKIYGIAFAENLDRVKEKILLKGADISKLRGVIDEHLGENEPDTLFKKVGAVTFAKKIFSKNDCENEKQLRCWNHAQVPFCYAESELSDDHGHPNAMASAAMIKFSQRPDIPLNVGWSVDGAVIEKQDENGRVNEDGKILSNTIALDLALTLKPMNPICRIFLEKDLEKSISDRPIPANIQKRFDEVKEFGNFSHSKVNKREIMIQTLQDLKKSINDYKTAMTNIKCHHCGDNTRFFKSATSIPSGCKKCARSYDMETIWKSLNK